jgi:hypothetical protein
MSSNEAGFGCGADKKVPESRHDLRDVRSLSAAERRLPLNVDF